MYICINKIKNAYIANNCFTLHIWSSLDKGEILHNFRKNMFDVLRNISESMSNILHNCSDGMFIILRNCSDGISNILRNCSESMSDVLRNCACDIDCQWSAIFVASLRL